MHFVFLDKPGQGPDGLVVTVGMPGRLVTWAEETMIAAATVTLALISANCVRSNLRHAMSVQLFHGDPTSVQTIV